MAIHVIMGPPCSGKSTWVRERAVLGDVVIDFDALAVALGGDDSRDYSHDHFAAVVRTARSAVVEHVLRNRSWHGATGPDAFIIHTRPSPEQLDRYLDVGAQMTTLDPGREIVLQRCRAERPASIVKVAEGWYRDNETQPLQAHQSAAKPRSSRRW